MKIFIAICAWFLAFAIGLAAQAANLFWDGTGSSWNSVTSWSTVSGATTPDPAAKPGAADVASFNITTVNTPQTINLDATQAALGLSFSSTGSVLIQSGIGTNPLNVGTSGITINGGSGAATISSPVGLAGSESWTNSSSNLFTVSGNISNGANLLTVAGSGNTTISGVLGNGSGGLTMSGSGTLSLSGSNQYTGATLVNSGILLLSNANALGSTASGTTVASGATLDLGGQITGAEALAISGTGVIGNGALINSSGVLASFAGAINSSTSGNFSVGGGAGPIELSGGFNNVSGQSVLTNGSGTSLFLSGAADNTNLRVTVNSGAVFLNKASSASVHAVGTLGLLTGSLGTVTLLGTGGDQILDSALVSVGGTFDTNGQSEIVGPLSLQGTGVGGAGVLANYGSAASILTPSSTTLLGNSTIAVSTSSLVLNNSVSGSFALTKIGAGILVLNGVNTYTGGTTVNAGSLGIGNNSAVGTGALTLAGGTIQADGASRTITNAVNLTAPSFVGGNLDLTLSGSVSGSASLTKNGIGVLTLSSVNTYTGGTTVNAGALGIGNNSALGTGALTMAGGTIQADGASRTITNAVSLTAPSFVGGNLDLTLSGSVNGSGILTKNGIGVLTLTGVNTYTGGTTLNAGVLGIGNNSAVGTGTVTMAGGTIQAVGASRVLTNTVNLTAPSFVGGNLDLTLSGSVNGSGSLTKNGIGVLTLSGVNAYTGDTQIGGGTLQLNNALAMQQSTLDYGNYGGVLSFGGLTGATLGGLKGNQNLALTNASTNNVALTVGTNNQSTSYAGVLSGGGSLIKSGTGTFSLSGDNTFTGGVTIAAGTLVQNGSLQSNVVTNQASFVYNGGTFSGQLVNQGSTTFNANFTAGNGVINYGTFTFGASQSLTSNGSGLDNRGTVTLTGGTIDGTGPLVNSATLTGFGTIGGNAGFANSGQFYISSGSLTLSNSGSNGNSNFINVATPGLLRLAGGNLSNTGLVQLSGGAIAGTANLVNSAGGTLRGNGSVTAPTTNSGGLIQASGSTALLVTNLSGGNTAGGELRVDDGSTLNVVNNFASDGTIVLDGANSQLTGGVVTNSGLVRGGGRVANRVLNSGVVRSESGDLTLANSNNTNTSSGRIEAAIGSQVIYSQGLAANDGTIALTGGAFDNNNRALSNTGIINGYGSFRTGGLTSTGKLNVGEGNLDVLGNVVNNGTIGIQGGRSAYFFGNVSGSGSYTGLGTPTFLAAVSPGNSPASVSFGGGADLTSTSTLNIELGGTTPGAQYDQLLVTGPLTIGGALQVLLINGFTPAAGNSFNLLDWGSLVGTFSSIGLPALAGGLTWNTSQLYSTGILSVVAPGIPGDYDNNGVVDAADYVVWRKGLGTIYTQTDYDVWRAHFGQSAGSGSGVSAIAAVPEPASVVLLMIAAAGWCLYRGRTA